MPLLMPKVSGTTYESNASGRLATAYGTALTSDGVAHTLPAGNATEIIASTTYDSFWVEVVLHGNSGLNTRTDSLVNIYAGAAGSEQLLIPDLLAGWTISMGNTTVNPAPKVYRFPLHVPAGTRLSGKHQSVRTTTAVYCVIRLFGGAGMSHWYGTRVECVGADATSSRGTSVTVGTASEGSLTSIGTNTYEWGFILPAIGGNYSDTTMNAAQIAADIGSGAATLIPGLQEFYFESGSNETASGIDGGRFARIPASTTLYLQAQSSTTGEAMDFCIYGVF